MEKKYITLKEFAAYFGMSHQSAYALLRSGAVSGAFQPKGKNSAWRIPLKGIEDWTKEREEKRNENHKR